MADLSQLTDAQLEAIANPRDQPIATPRDLSAYSDADLEALAASQPAAPQLMDHPLMAELQPSRGANAVDPSLDAVMPAALQQAGDEMMGELKQRHQLELEQDPWRAIIPGGLPKPVDPLTQWPLLLPIPFAAVSTPLRAAATNATIAGTQAIYSNIKDRMGASQKQGPGARLLDTLETTSADDLTSIGLHTAFGGAVGLGMYGLSRALTGPMRPMEPSRTGALPPFSTMETVPPLSPLQTVPPFTSPSDDVVALVTAHEGQLGAKGAAQQIVGQSTGIEVPMYPGPVQDQALLAVTGMTPRPEIVPAGVRGEKTNAAVDRAYGALRDTYNARTGGAPVDVTDMVGTLATMRARIGSRSGVVPSAIDPTDLQVIQHRTGVGAQVGGYAGPLGGDIPPVAERNWFEGVPAYTPPFGNRGTGDASASTARWLAPMDVVLRKMSALNTLKNSAIARAESGLDAADLRMLSRDMYRGLEAQLQGKEPALMQWATDTSRTESMLSELQVLIDKTKNASGVPVGANGVKTLLGQEHRGRWKTALREFYAPALEWFQQIEKLQQKEIGAKAVEAIAKATQGDALAAATAHQANLDTRMEDFLAQGSAMNRNFDTMAADRMAQAGAMASNTGAAIAQAARPPAMGASPMVQGALPMLARMTGGALGGMAGGLGGAQVPYIPGIGTMGGAGVGAVAGWNAAKVMDPLFRSAFTAFAAHPVGTRAFFQGLGRVMLVLDPPERAAPRPAPPPPPAPTPPPFPMSQPTSQPLGMVGSR